MKFKTGLRPSPEPPIFRFGDYLHKGQLPPIPTTFGHYPLIQPRSWGMLANDKIGDCTIAGPMHAVMMWNMIAGRHIMFTPLDAIDDYRDCCGYVPGDDSTDQGGDMVQVAKYWQKTGVRDNHNNRHKIVAYMHVDATRLDYLDAACYLFGAVGLGIRVGDAEEYAFEHDQPWIMPGTPDGGHYVPYVGKDLTYRKVVTWGGLQNVGEEWLKANLDEVVAYVSEESLINGKSFEGFDMASLEDDLQALT